LKGERPRFRKPSGTNSEARAGAAALRAWKPAAILLTITGICEDDDGCLVSSPM